MGTPGLCLHPAGPLVQYPGPPPDPGPGLPPVGSSAPPSRGWTRGAALRERESWLLPPETAQESPLPGLITPGAGDSLPLNSLPLGPGACQEGGPCASPVSLGWGPNPDPALEPKLVPAGLQGSRPAAPPHEAGSRQIQQPDRFRTRGGASWSPVPTPLDCGGLWLRAGDPCGPLPSSTAPSIAGEAVALCKRPATARSLTPPGHTYPRGPHPSSR